MLRINESNLYRCISDTQRLRILNLLEYGPLCVCHFQEILGEAQVKISKQLASIKQLGLVNAKREGTWMIYQIKTPIPGLLFCNLNYLRESKSSISAQLHRDLHARALLLKRVSQTLDNCPDKVCDWIHCSF
ncbi:MAG: metalloregulator ArsR/SmtB family transcription factor [Verrucomicrobiota bacterium]|nr:metalloregulator ArsR/SmtB family transcription factor [Verrucomicrobiota bacterium]MEC8649487.1 metalloregulator ArsR/SmtB family transcription factor [Verrucomicrobiota bacterium]